MRWFAANVAETKRPFRSGTKKIGKLSNCSIHGFLFFFFFGGGGLGFLLIVASSPHGANYTFFGGDGWMLPTLILNKWYLEPQGQPLKNGMDKWWVPTISYVKIGFIIQLIANHLSGWCSTPNQLLICSSFSREYGHPLLICSSLSTSQL